jgi:hypothetical protein
VTAGDDLDENCLLYKAVWERLWFREPESLSEREKRCVRFTGLRARHDLAMALKRKLDPKIEDWVAFVARRRPSESTDAESDARPAAKAPKRRHASYEKIDQALEDIFESKPKGYKEVVQQLERRVPLPKGKIFEGKKGWIAAYRSNQNGVTSWLSKRRRERGLPYLVPGPKK